MLGKVFWFTVALLSWSATAFAQTPPWQLQVTEQSCFVTTDKTKTTCGSSVLAHNTTTGASFFCVGAYLFHTSTTPGVSIPPDVSVTCKALTSPISGPTVTVAPLQSALVDAVPVKSEDGKTRRFFGRAYWVIGQKIEDIRMCDLNGIIPCSAAPRL